jgi:hypothetical protein
MTQLGSAQRSASAVDRDTEVTNMAEHQGCFDRCD